MELDGRDHPARPDGRRHHRSRIVVWAPGLTRKQEPAVKVPNPRTDPLPGILGELDLVITPVSVTPPRTWRHAAWFAVAASCVVLIVLAFAASSLTGPGGPLDRIDAFPGLPTGGLLTAQPPGSAAQSQQPVQPQQDHSQTALAEGPTGASIGTAPGNGQPAAAGDGNSDGGRPGHVGTAVPPPGVPGGQSVPPAPTVTVAPSAGRPPATPADLVETTRTFYEHLPADLHGAWAMVGPRVKAQGFEAFRQQWADIVLVRLQRVVVDPDASSVLATVQVVAKDGSEQIRQFQLLFHKSSSLLIDEIHPVGGNGIQPVG